MTNRLEIAWDLDGFIDEQRYYCSLNPISVANLPEPKAILAGGVREHIDTEITPPESYYIRIGSIRNGIEKLSPELFVSTVSSFKYFRIHITANNGDSSFTCMQEIEMSLEDGGQDITTPTTPITASSSYPEFGPEKLLDGNTTDQSKVWISNSGTVPPHFLTLQFSEAKKIVELRVWCQNSIDGGAAGQKRAPKDFIIQGSNDGIDWVNIRSFNNVNNWVAGLFKRFSLINGSHT